MATWADVNSFFQSSARPALSMPQRLRVQAFLSAEEGVSGTSADDFIQWLFDEVKRRVNRLTTLESRAVASPNIADLL